MVFFPKDNHDINLLLVKPISLRSPERNTEKQSKYPPGNGRKGFSQFPL